MKFLSSIVKHSLQLAKKPYTIGFSASPAVSVNEPINQQHNNQNIQQAEAESQPATTAFTETVTTDDNKIEIIDQVTPNFTEDSSAFEIHKDGPATEFSTTSIKNKKKTIVTSPESATQTEEPLHNSPLIDENNSKNTSLNKTLLQKHQTLQDETRTDKTVEASQTSLDPKQPTSHNNTKTKVKKSTALNKTHLQKHQTPQDQTRTDKTKNSANKQQSNNNHDYSESRTLKQTQVENTEYLNQNINNINNHNYSQQQAAKTSLIKTIHKTKQEIPQVRIGQINVLIEDQAKTASKPKPAAKTQSSSPFGYRGL
jgi:hypothetical protein